MMTPYQKRIRTFIMDMAPVLANSIVCKKNGEVEVKRAYYYTFGNSAEKWAEDVAQALKMADISGTVTARDDYANWPKTSYFTAVVREVTCPSA